MIYSSIRYQWSMCPYTVWSRARVRVRLGDRGSIIIIICCLKLLCIEVDGVLLCMTLCAQLLSHKETHTTKTSEQYPWLTGPSPMVQLMLMKVILTLLHSFHVCLTCKHAMLQVHS